MAEAMERKRNPSATKALDHRVQHRYTGDYLRREVVNWRKKKQLRNQTYRTRIRQSIDRALIDAGADLGDFDPVPVRRVKSQRRFWGPLPLGEWVEEKLAREDRTDGMELLQAVLPWRSGPQAVRGLPFLADPGA